MASFNEAIIVVLSHEGSTKASDGSRYGIGMNTLRLLKLDKIGWTQFNIDRMTEEGAKDFYHRYYWDLFFEAIQDQMLSNKLFDLAVVMGIGTAILIAQKAIRTVGDLSIVLDGRPGPATLAALNYGGQDHKDALLKEICEVAVERMKIIAKSQDNAKYAKGWVKRAQWPFEEEVQG